MGERRVNHDRWRVGSAAPPRLSGTGRQDPRVDAKRSIPRRRVRPLSGPQRSAARRQPVPSDEINALEGLVDEVERMSAASKGAMGLGVEQEASERLW